VDVKVNFLLFEQRLTKGKVIRRTRITNLELGVWSGEKVMRAGEGRW
jgi:hypothetical protein